MTSRFLGDQVITKSEDTYKFYAVRGTRGIDEEIFPLGQHSSQQVIQRIVAAPSDFCSNLQDLAGAVQSVLAHRSDPGALEHEAVLFWPKLNTLHAYLGMNLRADELIAALDTLRVQFRLRPVTVGALETLAKVLSDAARSRVFTEDQIDAWIDELEEAGLEPGLPLAADVAHGQ